MDKLDLIIWMMGSGFVLIFSLMLFMWHALNARIDEIHKRIERLENRLDKLDEKITDIDRRICRLEGAFSSKDCCMIKDDRQLRKAE